MPKFLDRLKSPTRRKRRPPLEEAEKTAIPRREHPGQETLKEQKEKITKVFDRFSEISGDEIEQEVEPENGENQKGKLTFSKNAEAETEEEEMEKAEKRPGKKELLIQKNKAAEIFRQSLKDEYAELGRRLKKKKESKIVHKKPRKKTRRDVRVVEGAALEKR